jgi:UDPglucose 6-dehydrogenase
MDVTIIGAGYVGLVTGVGLTRLGGHRVTWVESDPARVALLREGRMPIHEPGLSEAFREHADRVRIVPSIANLNKEPDFVLVAVATPIGEDGEPDLSQLRSATEALRVLPNAHVSVRSTLPPGTSQQLPSMLGRPDGARISTNPEFLREGMAMADYADPSRVVVGRFPEAEAEHLDRLNTLLQGINGPRLLVSVQVAEMIKNVANGFLALKLSFVNEIASLSEEYGVDVEEVLAGIALDPRIGSSYMRPGLGFGGSCLPKELQVLAAAGRRQGLAMHVARAASIVNAEQQERFARRVLQELGPGPCRIAVLGLSFKPNTDDLRGSPAVTVARRLDQAGHDVVAHDPVVSAEHAAKAISGIRMFRTVEEAADGADAVVVGTDWPEYAELDWDDIASRMRGNQVFDGRNVLNGPAVAAAGLRYRGVGRPVLEPAPRVSEAAPLAMGASRS